MVVPDGRKSLTTLRQEWEGCTSCALGETRRDTGGAFISGEGICGGIMFIGPGPMADDEAGGRPFIGVGGRVLRNVLRQMKLTDVYFTNTVCCRSFLYQYDGEGKQQFVTSKGVTLPAVSDAPPTPTHCKACNPRLTEEIYIVDPILIVALGPFAAETLLGRPIKAREEQGELHPTQADKPGTVLRLPGVGRTPALTPKGAWRRKVAGEWRQPTDQTFVEYPVMALPHPTHVKQTIADKSKKSPADIFIRGMQRVQQFYMEYLKITSQESTEYTAYDEAYIASALEYEEEP